MAIFDKIVIIWELANGENSFNGLTVTAQLLLLAEIVAYKKMILFKNLLIFFHILCILIRHIIAEEHYKKFGLRRAGPSGSRKLFVSGSHRALLRRA